MNELVRFVRLFAILSLSCSSVTNLFDGGGEVSGPIIALAVAASLDEQGELADESYSFAPAAAQVTTVVYIGELAESTALIVTWYRVGDQGDEQLFEHSIQVEALDRAYSIGANPGLLATGTYKAVATLGDATQTITWAVAEAQSEAEPESLENATALQTGQGQAPVSGASGKVSASQRAAGQATTVSGCTFEAKVAANGQQPNITFFGSGHWAQFQDSSCFDFGVLEVFATFGDSGNGSTCSFGPIVGGVGSCTLRQDPCWLGAPDLPGTEVRAIVRQASSGNTLAQASGVLSKDIAAPTVQLVSEPSNGVKVKGGQKIKLSAIAEELPNAGSWQTGVSKIIIEVILPSYEQLKNEPSGKSEAACEAKSKEQKIEEFKYTVPEDVRGDLRICAFAEDFADPPNIGKDCVTFPTGEVWEGTLQTDVTMAAPAGTCTGDWKANIKIFVNENGTASGTASVVEAPINSCGEGTFAVVGSQFSFSGVLVDNVGFTIPLSAFLGGQVQASAYLWKTGPNKASGTATPSYSAGEGITNSFVMTFALTCKACKP